MHSFQRERLAEPFCLLMQKKCPREVDSMANIKLLSSFVEMCIVTPADLKV